MANGATDGLSVRARGSAEGSSEVNTPTKSLTLRMLPPEQREQHVVTPQAAREQIEKWRREQPARWAVLAALVGGKGNDAA